MADFAPIVKKTFSFEGGYQAFPNDTANYNSRGELVGTNHGISAKALETYTGKVPTVQDIKNITEQLAQQIYKKNYWNPLQGDSLKNDSVAHIMFDSFIASGYNGLIRVRKAVNKYFNKKVVAETPKPITAQEAIIINSANQKRLFEIIKQGEIDNRNYLAKTNPEKYGKFIKGWLNRLDKITFSDTSKGIGGLLLLTGLFFLGRYVIKKAQ